MTSRESDAPPLATFEVAIDGAYATIAIAGELDLATRGELAAALDAAQTPGVLDLRLDLRDVEFVDAGSVGLLLGARRALAARGGALRVQAASPPVLRVLEVLDLMTLFGTLGDDDAALPA
jgi:anti-anti-sigma factor